MREVKNAKGSRYTYCVRVSWIGVWPILFLFYSVQLSAFRLFESLRVAVFSLDCVFALVFLFFDSFPSLCISLFFSKCHDFFSGFVLVAALSPCFSSSLGAAAGGSRAVESRRAQPHC